MDNSSSKSSDSYGLSSVSLESSESPESSESSGPAYKVYKLDTLPEDIYYFYLFGYLDIHCIWSLRLVSKKLYSIVRSYDINELSINKIFGSNWFTTTRPTKPKNFVFDFELRLLLYPSRNLINLKYLKVRKRVSAILKLEVLNKFKKLRILDIGLIDISSNGLLQLPHLEAFKINFGHCNSSLPVKTGKLLIDTPELYSLSIWQDTAIDNLDLIDDLIIVKHRQTIKFLKSNHYDKNTKNFTNLECLELLAKKKIDFLQIDLSELKNLKKIRCNGRFRSKIVKEFLRKNPNLEFYLLGVNINDVNRNYDFSGKKLLEIQMNNFSELEDDLNFCQVFNFNYFISFLPVDKQPPNLFNKYTNIQRLIVNDKIEDEKRLIQFISGCFSLYEFNVSRSSLKQEFFDKLTTISSISLLRIENEEHDLNFEFTVRIPYLHYFYTDQDVLLSNKLNLDVFQRLYKFEFKIRSQPFIVKKLAKNVYSINDSKLLGLPDRIDHKRLVRWSNYLRNKRSSARKRKCPF